MVATKRKEPIEALGKRRLPSSAIQALEVHFTHDRFPTAPSRSILAQHTGLSPRQVQVWFQNKRHRSDKDLGHVEAAVSSKSGARPRRARAHSRQSSLDLEDVEAFTGEDESIGPLDGVAGVDVTGRAGQPLEILIPQNTDSDIGDEATASPITSDDDSCYAELPPSVPTLTDMLRPHVEHSAARTDDDDDDASSCTSGTAPTTDGVSSEQPLCAPQAPSPPPAAPAPPPPPPSNPLCVPCAPALAEELTDGLTDDPLIHELVIEPLNANVATDVADDFLAAMTSKSLQRPPGGRPARSPGNADRMLRCGECDNCNRQDCSTCPNCLDMPKFGGPGVKKQACINRRCELRSEPEARRIKSERAGDGAAKKRRRVQKRSSYDLGADGLGDEPRAAGHSRHRSSPALSGATEICSRDPLHFDFGLDMDGDAKGDLEGDLDDVSVDEILSTVAADEHQSRQGSPAELISWAFSMPVKAEGPPLPTPVKTVADAPSRRAPSFADSAPADDAAPMAPLGRNAAAGASRAAGALPSEFELPLDSLDPSSLFGSGAEVDELIMGNGGVDAAAMFRQMPGASSETVLSTVAAML